MTFSDLRPTGSSTGRNNLATRPTTQPTPLRPATRRLAPVLFPAYERFSLFLSFSSFFYSPPLPLTSHVRQTSKSVNILPRRVAVRPHFHPPPPCRHTRQPGRKNKKHRKKYMVGKEDELCPATTAPWLQRESSKVMIFKTERDLFQTRGREGSVYFIFYFPTII